ncbi:outer membrane beta-barrel protein [Shewanella mangrovisoli]|uniref:outer membrane beta-barrel protein n=1 Tax=Shewanella mangrovisoli TaxID=2864211 RepID=UPI0035BA9932
MKYVNRLTVIAGLLPLTLALPTYAEPELFVAPYGGYSFGGSSFDINELDANKAETDNKQSVGIEEASHYGIMLGIGTNDPGNIYLLYSRQSSELKSGGLFTPDLVASLDVDYIHLGGTLFFPSGDFQPYITASAGVTRMMPDDWSTETRFSMGIGGGAEYRMTQNFALFADLRGYATFIDSDSSLFCNEDLCLWHVTSDVMWQVQANLGVKLSF